jgi:UDPglucose 6-dehydrogenase
MKVVVIGAGYVGLVSGACLADFGHQVICVDKDLEKISALVGGRIPIYEPGLQDIVQRNVQAKRLSFSSVLEQSVIDTDVVFVAVGTPARTSDGHADLSYVFTAAREIALAATKSLAIVVKSTVPVGTGDEIELIVKSVRPDVRFSVVSNPEFLREGAAIYDFKHPDRIVIGSDEQLGKDVVAELYRPLFINAAPVHFTGRRAAELIKHAANAFLATKITFINEVADLCEQVGADVKEVARGIGLDNRIGTKFLHAGPGFGGSCFPKDTLAFVKVGQDHGTPQRIVETVVAVNDQRKRAMARKVAAVAGGNLRGKTVAVLGLTFKPNTDDMREAPSLAIITALKDMGAIVRAYDPAGLDNAKKLLTGIVACDDAYLCATGCEVLVIVTEWEQFRALDLSRLKDVMARPVIVDLRNIYRPDEMAKHGFAYYSIGRRSASGVLPITESDVTEERSLISTEGH